MQGETSPDTENMWVFESALILVYVLLNYAFRLMSNHFAVVSQLEARYEQATQKVDFARDGKIKNWAEA